MFKLGDIALGRPNLGQSMPVFVYRLLEFYIMETIQDKYGREESDEIFREAGRRAGLVYAEEFTDKTMDFDDYVFDVQESLSENKIGILRVERANLETREITLSIYEDLDCSGLPVTGDTVCVYDEGFIGGIFEHYTGERFKVREVDCWASGERVCRFEVKLATKEELKNQHESEQLYVKQQEQIKQQKAKQEEHIKQEKIKQEQEIKLQKLQEEEKIKQEQLQQIQIKQEKEKILKIKQQEEQSRIEQEQRKQEEEQLRIKQEQEADLKIQRMLEIRLQKQQEDENIKLKKDREEKDLSMFRRNEEIDTNEEEEYALQVQRQRILDKKRQEREEAFEREQKNEELKMLEELDKKQKMDLQRRTELEKLSKPPTVKYMKEEMQPLVITDSEHQKELELKLEAELQLQKEKRKQRRLELERELEEERKQEEKILSEMVEERD